ncbi:class I SAM-dependent methyltransferase [Actinorugispora endophytica]|uniref:Methyltransferase family protein n=1 Tax=Actinorugispora endophytica TaxID=1605990 RepID=A0A4R6UWK0_9ACTN|nr:class I SAM-dependent methyltransferase [Actinorugispora endophytica]TDQ50273.1 methyltransferase family protein [Actinorugispora endophytica]
MNDHYEASAEFIDMMIRPWWERFGGLLADALGGVGALDGPVVDVGAGSGLAVGVIARALPGAEVVAVEPSPGMRAALLAGLVSDPDLRRRVTVLADGLLRARLPERVGALVAMNVIGHFPPEERDRVWALLARRLAPGGRAVLNLAPPYEPARVPLARMGDVAVGRNRYEGWARAEPAGADRLVWTMTYRVVAEDGTERETEVSYDWWTLTGARLAEEAAAHGLAAEPHGPAEAGFHVLRRA